MSDIEFILFLIQLLWNEVTDGDTPTDDDFDVIRKELVERDYDPDQVMNY